MPLSDAKLRALKPKAKAYKMADFDGLYVHVTTGGRKLWRLKYRIHGKEKLLSFGAYPAVSLAQARIARDAARADLAAGRDPGAVRAEERRRAKERSGNTFAAVADDFLQKKRKEGLADATVAKTEWLLGMAKVEFGSSQITDITAPTILRALRRVEARGTLETARRLKSKIGAVFRYAVACGFVDADPTAALNGAIAAPAATPRAAITDPAEFGALLRAIDGFSGQRTTRIALQLLAIVAQRPGELRQAEWREFGVDNAVWEIPAGRMKMRRPHRVPLPRQALDLLAELREITGYRTLLFPSLRGASRPMSENTLNAALRRLGYSGDQMTSHGFRASFSTMANESGLWSADAIERALAHVEQNAVRRAYARSDHWNERVRMSQWWADHLDALRTGRPASTDQAAE
jgi:integrase